MKKLGVVINSTIGISFWRHLMSYIGVVILAISLLGIGNLWSIVSNMQEEEKKLISSKMHIVAEDLSEQIRSMQKMVHQIATTKEYKDSQFISDKYLEYQLVDQFASLFGGNVLNFEGGLKYQEYENAILSTGTIMALDVYLENRVGKEHCVQIFNIIESLYNEKKSSMITYVPNTEMTFFLWPLKNYATYEIENSVIFFVIKEKDVLDRIKLLAGNFEGNLTVYYKDDLLFGSEIGRDNVVSFSKDGKIKVVYEPSASEIISFKNIFSLSEWALVACLILIAILNAFKVAWNNYKPIKMIMHKVDELLKSEKKNTEKVNEQYKIIREQMLRLIVKGGYNDSMFGRLEVLNLKLSRTAFLLIRCKINETVLTEAERYEMVQNIENLCDDESNFYSFWDEKDSLQIIVSLEEDYQANEAFEMVKEVIGIRNLKVKYNRPKIYHSLEYITQRANYQYMDKDQKCAESSNASTILNEIDSTVDNNIVRCAIECMNKNYSRPDFGVDQIAKELGITGVHLSRTFKYKTGINCKEYLLAIRMETAKKLLREQDITISQVCEQVGYVGVSSFIKLFQKTIGTTPAKYRHECRISDKIDYERKEFDSDDKNEKEFDSK